jgi:hypothetical protein
MTAASLAARAESGDAAARPGPGSAQRRSWRLPLAIAAFVLLGGALIALLAPPPLSPANGYLDPASTQPQGTRALADILAGRGTQVIRVTSAAAAVSAVHGGATTVVVTSPALLTGAQLRTLAAARVSLVIVEPDAAVLAALAPDVTMTGSQDVGPLKPSCGLPAAELAGSADMGGAGLRLAPGSSGVTCYPDDSASLAQYSIARPDSGPREITVLGTGAPLLNQNLASLGNAALALNLLSHRGQLAWLVPYPTGPPVATSGPPSTWSLIPRGTYLVCAELGVALLLTALWRARRLGPLVAEQLPVVVRAAETTEGHARLYQARRSRDRAAEALRRAAIARLAPSLGLPSEPAEEVIATEIAFRSRRTPAQARQLLYGPAPASDAELVRLADELDALEREVRAP